MVLAPIMCFGHQKWAARFKFHQLNDSKSGIFSIIFIFRTNTVSKILFACFLGCEYIHAREPMHVYASTPRDISTQHVRYTTGYTQPMDTSTRYTHQQQDMGHYTHQRDITRSITQLIIQLTSDERCEASTSRRLETWAKRITAEGWNRKETSAVIWAHNIGSNLSLP